jgi:hypothetical protein
VDNRIVYILQMLILKGMPHQFGMGFTVYRYD